MPGTGFPFPSGAAIGALIGVDAGSQAAVLTGDLTTKAWGAAIVGASGAAQQLDSVALAAGTWAVIGVGVTSTAGFTALVIAAATASLVPIATPQASGGNGLAFAQITACTVVLGAAATVYLNASMPAGDTMQGMILAARIV